MAEQYKYTNAYIDNQRANGKYSFTTKGLHHRLGVSANALKKTHAPLRLPAKAKRSPKGKRF